METTGTLIAKANPYPARSLDVVGSGLDSLYERIVAQDRPVAAPRRRRKRRLVLAVAVIGVLTGIAAGATYTTHTGDFGLPHMTENDTTELLRVDAPDFPALALKL